ncbi:MAG TPA: heavy-metal-associated domain-containing protein [Candidatus Mediterraneibacter cottocaccae]|nr:heavy-metal-associated domain-containing protein [Candidatus Mediterraneibacter cottocaccae]
MADGIIVLVIVVILIFALKGSIKHFKGEGACCGGGSGTVKKKRKKLSGPAVEKHIIEISGMQCQNCANSVANALNEIDGAAAKVDLKAGTAVVSCDRPVDDADLKYAVEHAGYHVVGIR